MTKSNAGRPTDMTDATVNKLEQAFSLGCTDVEACLYAGISRTTLFNYTKKNPEFVNRKAELKESLVLKSRTVIKKALDADDEMTAKWYLERKKKDEFGTKTNIENSYVDADGKRIDAPSLTINFVDGSPDGHTD